MAKKEEKKLEIKGFVSGFEIESEYVKDPVAFSKDIYFKGKNFLREENAVQNLGLWLIAANLMMKPFPPNIHHGLMYFALGHGLVAWDAAPPPPAPGAANSALEDEYYRQELGITNFRLVNKVLHTYASHSGQIKIEIDTAIVTSPSDYPEYIGRTLRIETAGPVWEERFIIGFETGVTDYWLLDSILAGAPTGIDYYIFEPVDLDTAVMNTISTAYLEAEVLIGSDDANGAIREFAFFGGDATSVLDSGVIFNVLRHVKIDKVALTWIARRVRFEIS